MRVRFDRQHPGYGRGVVEVENFDYVDEQELKLRLLNVFRSPKYRPPNLPSVAMDVMALSQRPNVAFADVSGVLERDGMMTGQVLKMSQSPLFAGRQRVTSIQQAMVRLGLRTVRDVVLQVALDAKVFRCKPYAPIMEKLRRHATAVGHLARAITRYTAFDAEHAFLCGLLHDVGIAGALLALVETAKPKPPPPVDEVWPAVIAIHEQASNLMASHWELPPDVCLVLEAHHRLTVEGHIHPMAAALALANEMAESMGFGLNAEPTLDASRKLELTQVLALTDAQFALIANDAETVKEHVAAM